ncbi:MAG TPA: trigger factor [Gaiellaceae bacterium]|nr:trigger factor [Gaiellaceae bacterium]
MIEQLGPDRVRLTVDVPAHDVHHAVEHAASDLAQSARIPGFRKGKVPMPVLVKRLGREAIYSEAVESHIGGWFWNAAARARLNPVAMPEYEYELPDGDAADWKFTATVEVQPKPEPADWTTLEVPRDVVDIPEEAVQAELQAVQSTAAELTPLDGRSAQDGDVAVVDLLADDGTAQRDYVIELGSNRLVEEIENGLRGLSAGEQREIAYELADNSNRKATVVLKKLYEKVLPPLDDAVVAKTSEFDTLDELRADIERRLREQIEDELEGRFRADVADELVKATGFVPRGPLVEARTRELLNGLARQLEARGVDARAYFQLTSQTPEQLEQRLRAEATQSVARELVLEAVADKLGLQVTDDEIREELREAGEPDEEIEEFIAQGGADRVRDDLRLKKALDKVAAEVKPIARELHDARESIWTPEQEQPVGEQKIWTPGSAR